MTWNPGLQGHALCDTDNNPVKSKLHKIKSNQIFVIGYWKLSDLSCLDTESKENETIDSHRWEIIRCQIAH